MNILHPMQAIPQRSLHTELVERLQELIIEGALGPGEKIPERHLCDQFGVSRTPMREALKVLAADGLVTLTQNRGAWVSQITLEDLAEVFPVMGALEALSGELACSRISDQEIASIRDLHQQMVEFYRRRELQDYFRANQAIHEAILTAAGNATLAAQYRSLAARVRRARYIANMTNERWAQAVAEHEDILAALELRDGPRLGRILKKHLHNKFETVRAWLAHQETAASAPIAGSPGAQL